MSEQGPQVSKEGMRVLAILLEAALHAELSERPGGAGHSSARTRVSSIGGQTRPCRNAIDGR
jgi:hypothetical protein